jgi:hypothetical protein
LASHDTALAKPVKNPVQFGVQREGFQMRVEVAVTFVPAISKDPLFLRPVSNH